MAHPIQIILMRQLAGYLSVPLFLVDPKGDLLFYNEPAVPRELTMEDGEVSRNLKSKAASGGREVQDHIEEMFSRHAPQIDPKIR